MTTTVYLSKDLILLKGMIKVFFLWQYLQIYVLYREWCTAPDMSVNRIVPGVATLNGCIYVVGGEQESYILSSAEFYDPKCEQWSNIANMQVERCEFGLCAVNGYLYALGGWSGGDIGGTIERYDPKLDMWRLVGNLPEPRFSMGIVSYDGNIIILINIRF